MKDRKAEHKKYYAANREAILARMAIYRVKRAAKMKECRDVWRAANPGKIQQLAYRRAGYPTPTRSAPDNCECCGRARTREALCLDHCHVTGKFRGWLCGPCNRAAGLLGDNIEGAKKLVRYLGQNA